MALRRFDLGFVEGTTSTSFVLPIDFDSTGTVTILCIGGGGGGSKRANNSGAGGGGGGGALAQGSFSGLQPGSTIYFQVGAAGAGGTTAGGQNGGDGGDTWVNITSNSAPTSTSEGVLAKGGVGSLGAGSGAGGSAASSIGSLGTASGGNGGTGGTTTGAGGGGGGAAGRYSFADNTYGNGGNGGNGYNAADGGGGGGGGVVGNGSSSFLISGANGGTGYGSAAGGTAGGAGAGGTDSPNVGGGGGGGGGVNASNGFGGPGGKSAISFVPLSGALSGNYGYSSGGGGGGGGSNNSGSTGGFGGNGRGEDAAGIIRSYGGGGGGGGAGVGSSGQGGSGGPGIIVVTYYSKENMLPTTNLSFNNIQSYFGGSNPVSLNEYYRNTGVVSTYARNSSGTLIPTSGQISADNFRGAPFKIYRQIEAGALITVSKFFTSVNQGYDSSVSLGSINSTGFTLSGGANVAISAIAKTSLGPLYFRVTSTSAVSNSGWEYMIIDEDNGAVYPRSEAEFVVTANAATWTWTLTNFLATPLALGSDFVIKFV